MRNQARRIVTVAEVKIQEIRLKYMYTLSQLCEKRLSALASSKSSRYTREIYVDYCNVSKYALITNEHIDICASFGG